VLLRAQTLPQPDEPGQPPFKSVAYTSTLSTPSFHVLISPPGVVDPHDRAALDVPMGSRSAGAPQPAAVEAKTETLAMAKQWTRTREARDMGFSVLVGSMRWTRLPTRRLKVRP
jgi:hypothetical protein